MKFGRGATVNQVHLNTGRPRHVWHIKLLSRLGELVLAAITYERSSNLDLRCGISFRGLSAKQLRLLRWRPP